MPIVLPELLMPAGSLDKLKVAISYGADAVYLGGQSFGLRAAAENFSLEEIAEGVAYAHARSAKVYVVLNAFLHDSDFIGLAEFVVHLSQMGVDAVIASDLGVINTIKGHSNIDIHLSTQASCLNIHAAQFWKQAGVKRIVLGREVSIAEASKIKTEVGIEVEMFTHGSLCMAYSGNCVISNYTSGRDSNRGGCAHSCRFEYKIETEDGSTVNAHFMSSKDLQGLEHLPRFRDEKIDSLKVEGRMKSLLYAGTIAKFYRSAIDRLADSALREEVHASDFSYESEELSKVGHRGYTDASLMTPAGASSIYSMEEAAEEKQYILVGQVVESSPEKFTLIDIRGSFNEGETLELIPFKGPVQKLLAHDMTTISGQSVERTKPSSLVKFPYIPHAEKLNIIRKKVSQ